MESDAWFQSNEPGFSDEDEEASKFYPEKFRFNNSEREKGRERSCLFAKQVEVFRSVKWTEIITSVTSLDENKHIIVESY